MGPEPEKNEAPENAPAVGLSAVHSVVSKPDFKGFADEILNTMWIDMTELDGADIQELAERHGLLHTVMATMPCGEKCLCNEFSDGDFPIKCLRKAY